MAGYHAALTAIWLALWHAWKYAPILFAAHAAAAALPWLLLAGRDRLSRPGRVLREIYPLVWILPLWTELDFLRGLLHDSAFDPSIATLDRALFGGIHLDAVWIYAMPQVPFSELMHALYFSYYPAVFLPPVYVLVTRRWPALRDMAYRLPLTYLACYLIYLVMPVDGPHFLGNHYQGPLTNGFFYQLVRSFQGAGDSMGCAFPSSHVAASVTMAYLGWRWLGRGAAATLTAAALGVTLSCVYTQNHYAIDALAGVAWALILQLLVAPGLERLWVTTDRRGRSARRPDVPTGS